MSKVKEPESSNSSAEKWGNEEVEENLTGIPLNYDEYQAYFEYDPVSFSALSFYRPQTDVVASIITHSAGEGIGRLLIGRKIGINSATKRGQRIVSRSISMVMRSFPDDFGTFQKMEGKYRMMKFFSNQRKPELHIEFESRFREITGRVVCPFKQGGRVRFPNTKLDSLRISDVTMKRIIYILEILKEEKVIVTLIYLLKRIYAKEAQEGYPFQIDKKSLLKCLLALINNRLCNTMECSFTHENVIRTFDLVTLPDIISDQEEVVQNAIKRTISIFNFQGKTFPTGQPCKIKIETNLLPPKPEKEAKKARLKRVPKIKIHKPVMPIITEKTLVSLSSKRFRRTIPKKEKPILKLEHADEGLLDDEAQEIAIRRIKQEEDDAVEEMPLVVQDESGLPWPMFGPADPNPSRKRRYDAVDLLSQAQSSRFRAKFTPHERDTLILIRAVCFYLNPAYRFWIKPTVMRDIMHEYVPESRSKTTTSLMATSVREIRNRLARMHYIVKYLGAREELQEFRTQIVLLDLRKIKEVTELFIKVFKVAYNVLYCESSKLSKVSASDAEFDEHLVRNLLRIESFRKSHPYISYDQFVNHRYHPKVFKLVKIACEKFSLPDQRLFLECDIGSLLVFVNYLIAENLDVDLAGPDSWMDIFQISDEQFFNNSGNQIKLLENACVKFDSMEIFATPLPRMTIRAREIQRLENGKLQISTVKPGSKNVSDKILGPAILRKMVEGMLVLIESKPGTTVDDLNMCYSRSLDPVRVEDILELLDEVKCCTIQTKLMKGLMKLSPFGDAPMLSVRYVLPVPGGLVRFAKQF